MSDRKAEVRWDHPYKNGQSRIGPTLEIDHQHGFACAHAPLNQAPRRQSVLVTMSGKTKGEDTRDRIQSTPADGRKAPKILPVEGSSTDTRFARMHACSERKTSTPSISGAWNRASTRSHSSAALTAQPREPQRATGRRNQEREPHVQQANA